MKKNKKPEATKAAPPAPKKPQWPAREAGKRLVLNIINANVKLPKMFDLKHWQEVTASLDAPDVQLKMGLQGIADVPDMACDAIWNAGSFAYLEAHEVLPILKECHRALVQGGLLTFSVCDMQRLGTVLTQGKIEHALYNSPAGGIAAIDLIYGHRRGIQQGRKDLKIQTGFTAGSLANKLTAAGFGEVEIRREGWQLQAAARKVVANPPDKPLVRIREEDMNEMMRLRDNIEKEPEMLKITPEDSF